MPLPSAALTALNGQITTTLQERFAALAQHVADPFHAALAEAAKAHGTLLESLTRTAQAAAVSTTGEGGPTMSSRVCWGAARAYRQGLHTHVLAPLATHLEALHIGRVLTAERRALLEALAALADDLVDTPHPTLHHLAAYHLQVRLPEALGPVLQQLHQRFARPLALLETQCTAHFQATLELERVLDRPAYHTPLSPLAPATPPTEAQIQEAVREVTEAQAALQAGLAQATTFDQHLHTLAEAQATAAEYPAQAQALAQTTATVLAEDVALAEAKGRTPRGRKLATPKPIKALDAQAEAWQHWYQRVTARLHLHATILGFLEAIDQAVDTLLQAILSAGVLPGQQALMQAEQTLRALHLETPPAEAPTDGPAPYQTVHRLLRASLAAVEHEPTQILRAKGITKAVQAALGQFVETLQHHTGTLPEAVQTNVLQNPEAKQVNPAVDVRTVRLQRFVRQAFDALLLARLEALTLPLAASRAEVRTALEEVPSILRFNLEGAVEEWRMAARAKGAAARQEHAALAQELAAGGLDRSADALAALVGQLGAAMPPVTEAVHETVRRGLLRLHTQLRIESPVQERLLDLRQTMATWMQTLAETSQEQAERGSILLRYHYRLGKRQMGNLLHLGQSAIGVAPVDEAEHQETLDALTELDTLTEQLPAVYRRLFSFRPVTDPVLLVGREADLKRLKKHTEQWERGSTNTLVITGHSGTGFTSFVNVARHTLFGSAATVHAVSIDVRLETEAGFAARIAEALGLPAEASANLEALTAHLLAFTPPEETWVCFIEHLEHLFLRKVGGTQLLDRILTFLSRTDSRVLWIGLTNDASWQFIEKAEPGAAALVVRHVLMPFDRAAVETLILNRHRRSGMALVFEATDLKNKPLLRQRLRKAATEEEQQALLHTDYFDRLYRTSGQNVMLSLFYWLRSVRVDESAQTVRVRPVNPLSFAFLDAFNLSHAFTLKTFLEHTTLTIAEHSAIFQIPSAESEQVFESLGNKFLIEPVPDDLTASPNVRFLFTTIDPQARYRLRPLVVHPIIAYLRRKNIVH